MNTVRSVGYGWGVLIVAGGGAYYFAKKSINKDRAERAEADNKRRMQMRELQNRYPPLPPQKQDAHANPSKEATEDMSPASGHAPESGGHSPFESSAPYRSKKGDRFS
ncbi:hypothetical protein E4T39_04215 [Aureobasidium subglaciale]|nr:hypothetical protein E4T39_04215 [Aureobasidium subglaciale]